MGLKDWYVEHFVGLLRLVPRHWSVENEFGRACPLRMNLDMTIWNFDGWRGLIESRGLQQSDQNEGMEVKEIRVILIVVTEMLSINVIHNDHAIFFINFAHAFHVAINELGNV